jgi:hypothetical protein
MGRQGRRLRRRFRIVAKKSKGEASADDDASAQDDAPKKSKPKRAKVLGPKTVAKPCLIGAGLLTLLSAALPK